MTVVVLKRTSDKLDAFLSGVVLLLGVVVLGVYLSAPRKERREMTNILYSYLQTDLCPCWLCGQTLQYQLCQGLALSQCEATFLSYPDTSLHFLLLTAATLFLGLLSSPIFYGNTVCGELFNTFSSIWKLRNNDPVTKELEWRRKMQLTLSQLKTGTLLTTRYSLYHGLGMALDSVTLLLVGLYTLHYGDVSLPTSYFALAKTQDEEFACFKPNKSLYLYLGLVSTLVMIIKTFNRFLCIGFSAGLPGLFGRNMILYADEIIDKNQEKVYNIQNNFCAILYHVTTASSLHLFVLPIRRIKNYVKFYYHGLAKTDGADEKNLVVAEPVEAVHQPPQQPHVEDPLVAGNGHAAPVEDRKLRAVPTLYHNWSDLLFIMDVMEDNAVDPCDILIFISKSDDLITVLEDKKVDIHQSRLDVATNTLHLEFTEAGIIERLLDTELYAKGGLTVLAWLEGPAGRVEAGSLGGKSPSFPVMMGTNYEIVSAVFGNGKMLARLPNFSFHPPAELKERTKKKYGQSVPLIAFTKSDRPLSLNFDIGR